jgi:hypothetical protein
MPEIPFSVPLTGIIRTEGNVVTIIVNRATTNIILEAVSGTHDRTTFEPGTNMFDILLASAQEFYRRRKYNRFTGTDLFNIARETYPDLNKRSFLSRITAATPDHPSYKHHLSHRDYFSRIATGIFTLEHKYLPEDEENEEAGSSDNAQYPDRRYSGDNR